jgi:hypothetical protein
MFRRLSARSLVALAALASCVAAARADALAVTSYDMPNGDGQAHGGSYNYWDATYDGHGHRHHDGSFLDGGTGALTDGVIATEAWNAVSNLQGTGEYVGWHGSPTITFHFASTVTIDSITLHVDDSDIGGVTAPGAIVVDGTTFDNSHYADYFPGPQAITLDDLHIVGNSVTLQLLDPTSWVFVSEITFDGSVSSVPETGNVAMMLAGLGLLGCVARRRRG